jgi:hypothetical protein
MVVESEPWTMIAQHRYPSVVMSSTAETVGGLHCSTLRYCKYGANRHPLSKAGLEQSIIVSKWILVMYTIDASMG